MGKYFVYVNPFKNKAYIHSTSCYHYIHRKPIDKSGEWSKEYATFTEAQKYADSTNQKDNRSCKKCID